MGAGIPEIAAVHRSGNSLRASIMIRRVEDVNRMMPELGNKLSPDRPFGAVTFL
mgnify:CR=1 FL=1